MTKNNTNFSLFADKYKDFYLITESGEIVRDKADRAITITARSFSEAIEIAICRLYLMMYESRYWWEFKPAEDTHGVRVYHNGEFVEELEVYKIKAAGKDHGKTIK